MSPFCQWIERDSSWVCSTCGAVVPMAVSADRPFAQCSKGTAMLGLDPNRVAVPLVSVRIPVGGPGTELKKLLKWFGLVAQSGCSCNERARLMNEWGPDGCEERIDEIVGWLREEAASRNLPFVDAAGRVLVRRAIANARRRGSTG